MTGRLSTEMQGDRKAFPQPTCAMTLTKKASPSSCSGGLTTETKNAPVCLSACISTSPIGLPHCWLADKRLPSLHHSARPSRLAVSTFPTARVLLWQADESHSGAAFSFPS